MDTLQYYYDDYFTYQKGQGYIRCLFKPGVSLQARELNNIQSMLKDQMSIGFEHVFKKDSVVRGCDFSIDKEARTFTVSEGVIFWNGYFIHIYEPLTTEINTEGEEVVGFMIEEVRVGVPGAKTVVDETDELLGDNAAGFTNSAAEGADRLKFRVSLRPERLFTGADFVSFMPFKRLKDGEVVEPRVTQVSDLALGRTLAQRTMEESGHYVVSGMDLYVEENGSDPVLVGCRKGVAYVNGYRIEANTDVSIKKVAVPRAAVEVDKIDLEVDFYDNSTHIIHLNKDFVYRGPDESKRLRMQMTLIDFFRLITTGVNGSYVFTDSDKSVESIIAVHKPNGDFVDPSSYTFNPNTGVLSFNGVSIPTSFYVTYAYSKADALGPDEFTFVQTSDSIDHYDVLLKRSGTDAEDYVCRLALISGASTLIVGDVYTDAAGTPFRVIDENVFVDKYLVNVLSDTPLSASGILSGATINYIDIPSKEDVYYGCVSLDKIDETFFNSENRVLLQGGRCESTYYVVLGRTDSVFLTQDGELVVVEGPYVDGHTEVRPTANEPTYLHLGYIRHYPYVEPVGVRTKFIKITNRVPKRVTMRELNAMQERLTSLEENVANLALEAQTKDQFFSSSLRGLLVDDLGTFDRVNNALVDSHFSVDPINRSAQLPVDRFLAKGAVNDFSATVQAKVGVEDNDDSDYYFLMRTAGSDAPAHSVSDATGLQQLNGFSKYFRTPAHVVIRPAGDDFVSETVEWLEDETVESVKNVNSSSVVTAAEARKMGISPNFDRVITEVEAVREVDRDTVVRQQFDKILSTCRPIKITISAKEWWHKDAGGTFTGFWVKCYFDGREMNIGRKDSGVKKKYIGPVGEFNIEAWIPEGVPQGVKEVRVVAFEDEECTRPLASVVKPYNANAKEKIVYKQNVINVERTIVRATTIVENSNLNDWMQASPASQIDTVRREIDTRRDEIDVALATNGAIDPTESSVVRIRRWGEQFIAPIGDGGNGGDPLLQSFIFYEPLTITKFEVYLTKLVGDKPSEPIKFRVRNMVNGYPGHDVWAEATLPADEVNICTQNEDGTWNMVPTVVEFPHPVYIPANTPFGIVMLTADTTYAAFIAEMGARDVNSGKVVTANPYLQGLLFTSSNDRTWTAHQTKDLTCKIHTTDQFEKSGYVIFQKSGTFSRFAFFAEAVTPDGCTVDFYYRATPSGTVAGPWIPFEPNREYDLEQLCSSIEVKAILRSESKKHTPLLLKDHSLILSRYVPSATSVPTTKSEAESAGGIVWRKIEGIPSGYDNVKLIVDVYQPDGTDIFPVFKFVDTDDLEKTVFNDFVTTGTVTVEDLGGKWQRRTYQFQVSSNPADPNYLPADTDNFRGKIILVAPADGSVSPKVKNVRWLLQQM